MPVVVLTARDREEDEVAALDHGADDYLTKPFGTGELMARLREKIEENPSQPESLITESGIGYRLKGKT